MFDLTLDIAGLDELEAHIAEADRAFVNEVVEAVQLGAGEGERHAKASTAFEDRSTDLRQSIRGYVESTSASGAVALIEATAPHALFVEEGTKPHDILPGVRENGKRGWLAWEGEGGAHFARGVHHPGTAPRPFIAPAGAAAGELVRATIDERAPAAIQKALGG